MGVGPLRARLAAWHWLTLGTTAIVVLNLVRAVRDGYVPLGDSAFIEARALDVLSRHPPLLNMLSTVSEHADVHHPGPLLFDVLAIPVRLAPHGLGLPIGAAAINIAAVFAIGWCAARVDGERCAAVAAAVTAALVWSFGGPIWLEAWQPHVTMLPFLLFLVACWGFAAGRDGLGVIVVIAGSFVVQTHGSYVVVVPAVAGVALLLRLGRAGRPPLAWRRAAGLLALAVVLWFQPIVQQVGGSGPGNFTQIVTAATDHGSPVLGLGRAVRAVGAVVAVPPWFLRPGVETSLPIIGEFAAVGLGPAIVAFAVLALLVAAAVSASRRRGDAHLLGGAAVAIVAVTSAVLFVARLPVDATGFMIHRVRLLWPCAAFVTIIAVVGLIGALPDRAWRRSTVAAVVAAGLASIVANVPEHAPAGLDTELASALEAPARELRRSMAALEDRGVVYLAFGDTVVGAGFALAVIPELIERQIPVRVSHPIAVAQLGDRYRLDGAADLTLRFALGAGGELAPDRTIASATVALSGASSVVPTDAALLADGQLTVHAVVTPFDPADVTE